MAGNLTEFWTRYTTTQRMKGQDAMYAKFCVNQETAINFMRLFLNQRACAIQGERPLPNGSVPYYLARDSSSGARTSGSALADPELELRHWFQFIETY